MTGAASANSPFDGHWQNERGSVMDIAASGRQIAGTYRTALGAPDKDDSFPLTGFCEGNLIGFVVAWHDHDSLTSWVGRYESASDEIHTLWHLVIEQSTRVDPATGEITKEEMPLWEAFRTQHSVFRRVKN